MPFPLTLYPNTLGPSTTLSTANPLYSNPPVAAGSVAKTQLVGTATGFGEFQSQGNAGAWAAGALNLGIAPTGHGWFLDTNLLDQMFFPDGLWTARARVSTNANTATVDLYYRVFVYDPVALTYTLVGVLSLLGNAVSTVALNTVFTAQELPPAYFKGGQRLYIDLWGNITATTMVAGNTLNIIASNQPGSGLATTNLQTPGYVSWDHPRYVSRALGGTIIPDPVTQPLPYIERALGSTIVYENRIFIPRALGGVYIQDDPANLWVPRALGGTTQIPVGVVLSCTIPGVGTLTSTFSLATALTDTIPGVGTLTATLSANTALTCTIPGVGTLSGTFTLATSLSVTIAGVGTLAGTFSLATALTATIPGVGTLSGVFSLRTALSLTCAGVGTLSGTLSVQAAVLLYLSTTCVTRDMQARAVARDMQAIAVTRDEKTPTLTRDEKATALTRDEKATALTRS